MSSYSKDVDAYIAKSAGFARPILEHMREVIHSACSDVTEKIKWGMPFFDYGDEMMCHIAAFKQYAVLGFWKGSIMKDPILRENASSESSMGHLGRITSLKDLPSDKKLTAYIKEAMKLNDDGIKVDRKPKSTEKKELTVPDYFQKAINKNKKAKTIFDAFAYSHKKEYVEWITEAKTDATREKRISSAIEMMQEGKSRHWKYQK